MRARAQKKRQPVFITKSGLRAGASPTETEAIFDSHGPSGTLTQERVEGTSAALRYWFRAAGDRLDRAAYREELAAIVA